VFFAGNFAAATGAGTQGRMSFGAAHNNSSDSVSQGCVAWGDLDAQATMLVNAKISDQYCLQQAINNAESVYASAGSFDASGFTLTYASNSAVRYFAYLALELPDPDDAYVAIKDSKTSTGTQAYTGAGFTPDLLFLLQTALTSANSLATSDVGSISIGVAQGTSEVCTIFGSQDAAADSNTYSRRDESNILNIRDHADSVDAVAALDTFDSDGWTLNYSDGSASARKMLAIAIGNSAGSTPTTITVGTAAVSITPTALTIKKDKAVSVATAAVTITPTALTIVNNTNIEISVTTASVSITPTNLKISQHRNISVSTAAVSIAPTNLTIVKHKVVSVTTQAVTITPTALTIDQQVTGETAINVVPVSVTISKTNLSINQIRNISVGTASVSITPTNTTIVKNTIVSVTPSYVEIVPTDLTIVQAGPTTIIVTTPAIIITPTNLTIINQRLGWTTVSKPSSIWSDIATASSIWTEV
jgi:hypothetical protein